MAHIKKIRYKNILSTGNVWQEYAFDEHGLTLIIGKNGSGKTTVIDALHFALYGEAYRDIVQDKIPNSVNKKDCLVELTFLVGKTEYFVRRGIKPTILEIYVDGVLLPKEAKSKEYGAKLVQIFGIDKQSFRGQVTLASRSFQPFMRLKAEDRRKVIQELLDIQVFSVMAKINKDRMDLVKEALNKADKDTEVWKHKIDLERTKITVSQDNIMESVDRYKRRNIILEEEIEHLKNDVSELLDQIANFDKLKNDYQKNDDLWKNNEYRLTNVRDECKTLNKRKGWYKSTHSCQTCKQTIDETFREQIISDITLEFNEKVEQGIELSNENKSLKEKIAQQQAAIDEFTKISSKITQKNNWIESKRKEIITNNREIQNLLSDKATEATDESLINQYQINYNKAVAEYDRLSLEQDKLKAAKSLLSDEGMKATVVSRYLPIINASINKYLREFELNAIFEMNDTFKEKITDQYGEVFQYGSFSEGEKMRFDLAIMFTWRDIARMRNTTDTNLLILDEVLDASLDDDGAQDFMRVITKVVKDTNTIVISHQSKNIIDQFDRVIKFTKKKKFSQMEIVR